MHVFLQNIRFHDNNSGFQYLRLHVVVEVPPGFRFTQILIIINKLYIILLAQTLLIIKYGTYIYCI